MNLRRSLLLLLFALPVSCELHPQSLSALQFQAASPLPEFERVGPFGGEVRSLLINSADPDLVFLGTSDGRIFKSADAGLSWAPVFPGLPRRHIVVDTLVQHPTEYRRLFAGGWDLGSDGGGLFESSDGGISWHTVALPGRSQAVRDLAICRDDPAHMIVGTLSGAYLSVNGGAEWRRVTGKGGESQKIESVAIDPKDPKTLYVGTWRLGYKSKNSGSTWAQIAKGMLLDSDLFSISIDPRNPGLVYASTCSGIYRSVNRGASWKRLKLLQNRFGARAHIVYIDPVYAHRIYGGTTEGLFVSENDGQDWKRITSSAVTVNAIQVNPRDNRKILVGTKEQGILRSEDAGRSWKVSNQGFVSRQVSRIIPDSEMPGRFIVGVRSDSAQSGFYLYDNPKSHWSALTLGAQSEAELMSFLSLPDGLGRVAGSRRGGYLQSRGSESWAKLSGPIGALAVNDLAYEPLNKWIFAATNQGLYRARPGQVNFQRPGPTAFLPELYSITVAQTVPPLVYAASSLGVIRFKESGDSWDIVSVGLPIKAIVQNVAISPGKQTHLFAGTTAGLFESKDAGATWQKAGDTRLGVDVPSVIFLDRSGQTVAAADNSFGGIFISVDGGATWNRIESPAFASPVRCVAKDPSRPGLAYLGTRSEGIYRLQLPPQVAGESR